MRLSLSDGPPAGEVRGADLYSSTSAVGFLVSLLLVYFAWYRENTSMARRVAMALALCASILLVATVIYFRAARDLRLRAYASVPLPIVLWMVAAGLVLWERNEAVLESEEDSATMEAGLLVAAAAEGVDG